MESKAINPVTAAVLADAAFDAVGEAAKFSTQRYRGIIEQIYQTGELPQTWRPRDGIERTRFGRSYTCDRRANEKPTRPDSHERGEKES
jgi:hypothetical protein